MTNDELVAMLRAAAPTSTAVQLAELIADRNPNGLTEGILIVTFKLAFPEIPLRTLREAGAWSRVSNGGFDDDRFEELLRPYLAARRGAP